MNDLVYFYEAKQDCGTSCRTFYGIDNTHS